MSGEGGLHGSGPTSAEHAIASFRASTDRTIGEWSDAQLDHIIATLRRNSNRRPENFSLLMFLEDARLRRHELRAAQSFDGHGPRPEQPLT